jgi:glycosyltransferase involved in cell wall biosynthesis
VDDCSQDESLEIARELENEFTEVRSFHHEVNQGKGAALRTGFREATGDIVAVQDADLEYDPHDLRKLIQLIQDDKADVALGSRFITGGAHRVIYFWHSIGNRFLTFFSNMMTDLNLSDMETCYKVFRREVLQGIEIQENRFGFEPEIVAKVSRKNVRIFEMGISYSGRTYDEGKKIGMKDGFRAIYCILRYNVGHLPLGMKVFLLGILGMAGGLVTLAVYLSRFLIN